jgi:hypothetical protein
MLLKQHCVMLDYIWVLKNRQEDALADKGHIIMRKTRLAIIVGERVHRQMAIRNYTSFQQNWPIASLPRTMKKTISFGTCMPTAPCRGSVFLSKEDYEAACGQKISSDTP